MNQRSPYRLILGGICLLLFTFVGGILLQRQVGVGNIPKHLSSLGKSESTEDTADDFPYEILAIGEAPDPQTATYPNCLLLARLRERNAPENEFMAHLWAFEERQATSAIFLRPGDRIGAELIPWENAGTEIQRTRVAGDLKSSLTTPQFFLPSWDCSRPLPQEANTSVARLIRDRDFFQLPEEGGMIFPPVSKGFYEETPLSPGIGNPQSAVSRILEFHEDLKRNGIDLFLCPVPDRRGIYADTLTDGSYDPAVDGSPHTPINAGLLHLREQGVKVIDTYQILTEARTEGEVFMLADHHWTSLAAMKVAHSLASTLQRPTPPTPLRYHIDSSKSWTYRAPTYQNHPLVKGLGASLNNAPILLFEVVPEDDPATRGIAERTDHSSDILLLSASHGHFPGHVLLQPEPTAGLHAHLTAELGEPVNLLYVTGNSHNLARREFIRQKLYERTKQVIWVFMEQHLTEAWQEIRILSPE